MTLSRRSYIVGGALLVISGAAALAIGREWGLSDFGELSKILAFLSAASYFAYRVLSGFFVTNASLHVECIRTRKNANIDYLAVRVVVEKGDQGILIVREARVRVTPASGGEQERSLLTVHRAISRRESLATPARNVEAIMPEAPAGLDATPAIRLNPGEKTELSTFFEVARDMPCSVEALLVGRKPSHRAMGQWRASATALPLLADTRDHPPVH